ncbi:MAG TPA: recombination regulator RecX [Methylophilaceae bacterium]|nr:recombination regulator RecX [Methylophilaceae bacterium]HQR60657.1 recombination regulator RecX [Methylophilaceae bacterium]
MRKPTPSLRERALGYLTRREYSRAELYRKLHPYAEEEDLDALLDEFKQRGWLSDQRYADQMVHARKGKFGSLKVAHELRSQGVAEELVVKAAAEIGAEDKATARNLWRKKFGATPQSREEWAKQARFLQSRGFGTETIKAVLRGDIEDLEQ